MTLEQLQKEKEELSGVCESLRGNMSTPANEWREEDCPFCPMVFPNNDVLNIEPLNPVVEGHRIFIPRQHVTDFAENAIVSNAVMFQVQQHAQKVGGDFNIITSKGKNATQSVFHLHVHFVPRRENDGLMLPWTGKNLLDQHSAHIVERIWEWSSDELRMVREQLETEKDNEVATAYKNPTISTEIG